MGGSQSTQERSNERLSTAGLFYDFMSGNESAVEGQVTEQVKIDEEAKVSAYL